MLMLAIETSGQSGGVAISRDSHPVAEVMLSGVNTYSRTLMPSVKWLMDSAGVVMNQLECIAVSVGPGSFTGLRIGIATARGLSFALNIPLVGIPSFDVAAYNIPPVPGLVLCPLVDARKSAVYTTFYLADYRGWNRVMPFQLATPAELHEMFTCSKVLHGISGDNTPVSGIIFLGDGLNMYRDVIATTFASHNLFFASEHLWSPRPMSMAVIARRYFDRQGNDCGTVEPLYIRPSQAEERKLEQSRKKMC